MEVASNLRGLVAVRNSKDPDGPKLSLTEGAWSVFVQGIKQGEFEF